MEARHQWQARLGLWQNEAHGHAYAVVAAERIIAGAHKVRRSCTFTVNQLTILDLGHQELGCTIHV
jgi:hypothetical protein